MNRLLFIAVVILFVGIDFFLTNDFQEHHGNARPAWQVIVYPIVTVLLPIYVFLAMKPVQVVRFPFVIAIFCDITLALLTVGLGVILALPGILISNMLLCLGYLFSFSYVLAQTANETPPS